MNTWRGWDGSVHIHSPKRLSLTHILTENAFFSVGPHITCPRHQPSGDGQPEGERAERPEEHADPREAAQLHDRGPQ